MASSTELLWRCLGRIAERWSRERDIRDERGGLFDPRDSQRLGHCSEHGAAIPEYAGGDATEAAAATRVEIGAVHGIHRQTDGGKVGELSSAAAGAASPGVRGELHDTGGICAPSPAATPASGHGAVRDGTRGTGPGGLGQLQLRGRKGAEAANVGFRDGAGLVSGHLRGICAESGHGQLHPVPGQHL